MSKHEPGETCTKCGLALTEEDPPDLELCWNCARRCWKCGVWIKTGSVCERCDEKIDRWHDWYGNVLGIDREEDDI